MPSHLLHDGAVVLCMHSGDARPMMTDRRVKVNGQYIVTESSGYTISACTWQPPPPGRQPCASATWTTAATRVKASNVRVLLKDSQATCTPNGTGVNIVNTQTRVKGT